MSAVVYYVDAMRQTARIAFFPAQFALTENHSFLFVGNMSWILLCHQMLYVMPDALNGYTNGCLCLDIME